MLKVALTKGRIEKKVTTMLEKLGYDVTSMINKNRELQINVEDKMEIIFAKSNDVVTFIEHGIVDIGIVGSDTLLENSFKNYYELLDLEIGKCSFAVCSYPEYKNIKLNRRKRIATKYPNVAKKYFESKDEDVEIIKLEGSVELGPVVGLTDAIVDIVETGATLRANGLEVIEKITDVSTRLICNKTKFKYKKEEILNLIDLIENNNR
ncbi:aTP phosphoribosyltransferase [Clostridium sp. CAG:440]|nr:aTP phosphoribosyltransferase [Clostridium sp. CAG:440]